MLRINLKFSASENFSSKKSLFKKFLRNSIQKDRIQVVKSVFDLFIDCGREPLNLKRQVRMVFGSLYSFMLRNYS